MRFFVGNIVSMIIVGLVIVFIGYVINLDVTLIVTYVGLFVSVYGVILTLLQVMKIKKTTDATEEAVISTRKQMNLVLSVSDTAKHVANIRFIKECITNDKLELARIRLSDVKDFMGRIGYIDDLEYDKSKYKKLINSLEANLNSIEQKINANQEVDKLVFCKDIERVATFLIDVENNLKSR